MRDHHHLTLLLLLAILSPACSLFSSRRLSTAQFIEESKTYAGLEIASADYVVRAGDQGLSIDADLSLQNQNGPAISAFKFYISRSAHNLTLKLDGNAVPFEVLTNTRYQKVLSVVAQPPIEPGARVRYVLTYSYEPPPDRLGSSCRLQPGATHVYDALWVPRIQPGEERPLDLFPYTMTIEARAGETAITNGALTEVGDNGAVARYRYVCDQPAHPFVAIGRYRSIERMHGDTRLTAYVYERYGDAGLEHGRQYLEFISRLLDVYTRVFGPIPLPSYRLISIDSERANFGINAGMLLSERHFRDEIPDGAKLCVVAHELAHAWWAHYVRSYGPGSGLVTEAMCNYAAAVGFGELFGPETEAELYHTYREFYRPVASDDIPLGRQDGYQEIYYRSTYNRGALVLRMLELKIGREHFHEILRRFVTMHGEADSVQAHTFLDFVQANTTEDLHGFFDDFIWGTALPDYRLVDVTSGGAQGGSVVTVANDGTGSFPVTVRMTGIKGEMIDEQVTLGYRGKTEIRTSVPVSFATIDPDGLVPQSSYSNDCWPRQNVALGGRITRDGQKLAGSARVEIWRRGSLPEQYVHVREVTSDSEGRFLIPNLAPDRYLLTVRASLSVPHQEFVDLRRNGSVEISLQPVQSAHLLGFVGGKPQIRPMTADGDKFRASRTDLATDRLYVILDQGRGEEIVVVLPEPKVTPWLGGGSTPVPPDTNVDEVAFDPAALDNLRLAAMSSQESLRTSLLKPSWYLAPFLP
jgi:hypothetical protein